MRPTALPHCRRSSRSGGPTSPKLQASVARQAPVRVVIRQVDERGLAEQSPEPSWRLFVGIMSPTAGRWRKRESMGEDKQTAFVNELEVEIKKYRHYGKTNNLSDVGLTMVSIIGSIAAAVVAAASGKSAAAHYLAAGFAALPAACTSYQRTAKLRERASLHFEYAASVTGLVAGMKYAKDPNLEQFATEWAHLVIAREKRFSETLQSGVGTHPPTRSAPTGPIKV